MSYVFLQIIINQERTITISMVTREVNSRNKIHSFKIKVICHIIGNSKLGKRCNWSQHVTQKLFWFFFLCFPIFQSSLVNRQTCANESNNDETLFDCKQFTLSQLCQQYKLSFEVNSGKLKEKYRGMSAYSVIHSLKLAQTDTFNSMPVKFFSHLGTSNYLRGLYLTPSQGNASLQKKLLH